MARYPFSVTSWSRAPCPQPRARSPVPAAPCPQPRARSTVPAGINALIVGAWVSGVQAGTSETQACGWGQLLVGVPEPIAIEKTCSAVVPLPAPALTVGSVTDATVLPACSGTDAK
jgi:hypothetical protein